MISNSQKLCLTTSATQSSSCNGKIYDKIIKPKVDQREYRGLILNNGLKIMVELLNEFEFVV